MRKNIFKAMILLAQISILTGTLGHAAVPINARAAVPGLVAAYGFEEGSGSTLNDNSGNSNNGTLQNGPSWVTNGKFGKALRFDGGNDRVSIPDSNSLDLTTGMTLEAWVYPTSIESGWDAILIKEYGSGPTYSILANGDGNTPYTYISSNNIGYGAGGGTTLPVNSWTHVAATFDGATIRLFLNGTQVKTVSFSGAIQVSARELFIGGSTFLSNEGFPGVIDEVRIYNRALSASEIASDMTTPIVAVAPTASPTKTTTPRFTATSTSVVSTATRTPTKTTTSVVTATRTPTPTRTPTLALTVTQTPTTVAQVMGPLKASTVNPRYFANPNGTIVYLTGSHTWCNFMDCDDTNPISATFNYSAFLDFLVANNHNFFRLWRAENARGGEAGANFWFAPMHYQRSTVCCAFDGGNKFDLTKFDQAYFDRMRQRVIAARDRGIYVSIMLFDGWSVESKFGGHEPWPGHPYKLENNINNIDGDQNNDNQGGETHTLASSYLTTNITPLQEAYIRKVVDTVNDLDNVLYEVSNESSSSSTAWEYHMVTYVHNYEATKSKQHPVGMTWQWPGGNNNDLYNSPADWISLGGNVDINTYVPPAANGSKVILADTDHLCGICGNRQWVWKSFTRGENPIFMDVYDPATSSRGMYLSPTGNEAVIRTNLGYTRNFAKTINLAAMTPQPSLCSTGYCLAKTSTPAEYLAFLPNGGTITMNLKSTSGTLTVEWFNPATGSTTNGGTVNGGANRSLTPPFSGDAVLHLKSQ
jgi:hypothetical protein